MQKKLEQKGKKIFNENFYLHLHNKSITLTCSYLIKGNSHKLLKKPYLRYEKIKIAL